ncbi:MAG TPA: GGDEF domain-containing protein [Desulfocapsa sulfexigens]|nr:GGDEF domain-containing protein [Desulfocapsa sulfexigens]
MFTRISDKEFEQTIIRLIIGSSVILYLLMFAPFQKWMVSLFPAFVFISLGLALHVYFNPGNYLWRRMFGQIIDIGSISFNLFYCGIAGGAIIGVYQWIIIGNGFRFGVKYLLSATVLTTVFFSIVALKSPFWVEHKFFSLGIVSAQLLVPFYFAVLLKRLQVANKNFEQLSLYDGLTGLMNRHTFDSRISSETSRLKRFNTPFALALLDIDHFKNVNDTYGHLAGDIVLRKIAEVLKKSCRDGDIVARFGGEEFALLLPGNGRRDIALAGERLRMAVEQLTIIVGDQPQSILVTVSVGIAYWNDRFDNSSDWIQSADKMLYEAKRQGRNRVVVTPIPSSHKLIA